METTRTPYELAALATAALPGLQVTAVPGPDYADEFVSSTYIVDARGNSWHVVAPTEELSPLAVQTRGQVLDYLHTCARTSALPFEVPRLEAAAPTRKNTFAFIFTVTAGDPLDEGSLASAGLLSGSLGRALTALHNLNPAELGGVTVPQRRVDEIRRDLLGEISSVGRELSGQLRKRWLTALKEDVLWSFEPAPIHAHLSAESIRVQGGAVISVTGLERAEIGDPASDLAWLLPLVGDGFLEGFTASYSAGQKRPDLHVFTRAQLYSELALLSWLRFGQELGDQEVIAEAREMLADLDRDLAGAMLVQPTRPVVEVHFEAEDEPLRRIDRGAPEPEVGAVSDPDALTEPHAHPSSSGTFAASRAGEASETAATDVFSGANPAFDRFGYEDEEESPVLRSGEIFLAGEGAAWLDSFEDAGAGSGDAAAHTDSSYELPHRADSDEG